jgi:hypothetical protein
MVGVCRRYAGAVCAGFFVSEVAEMKRRGEGRRGEDGFMGEWVRWMLGGMYMYEELRRVEVWFPGRL